MPQSAYEDLGVMWHALHLMLLGRSITLVIDHQCDRVSNQRAMNFTWACVSSWLYGLHALAEADAVLAKVSMLLEFRSRNDAE